MTFTVDIHHHILPDFFWAATNEAGHPVGGIQPPAWSRASTLSFLGATATTQIPHLATVRPQTQSHAS